MHAGTRMESVDDAGVCDNICAYECIPFSIIFQFVEATRWTNMNEKREYELVPNLNISR